MFRQVRPIHVVLPVVIHTKNASNLDGVSGGVKNFRMETDRFRHIWTRVRRVRDREAPGSNPGPPTNS